MKQSTPSKYTCNYSTNYTCSFKVLMHLNNRVHMYLHTASAILTLPKSHPVCDIAPQRNHRLLWSNTKYTCTHTPKQTCTYTRLLLISLSPSPVRSAILLRIASIAYYVLTQSTLALIHQSSLVLTHNFRHSRTPMSRLVRHIAPQRNYRLLRSARRDTRTPLCRHVATCSRRDRGSQGHKSLGGQGHTHTSKWVKVKVNL